MSIINFIIDLKQDLSAHTYATETDKSAEQDMSALTCELIEGLKLRWANTNLDACKHLEKVMEWDNIHSDLRVNLLGWLTLRSVDQILEEGVKMIDATTITVTEMGEKVMIDVVGIGTDLLYTKNNELHLEISTETSDLEMLGAGEYSSRVENKIEKLRMKWAVGEYEIVLEKLEMLESWKTEEDTQGVKEEMLDWMINNKEVTLVEEGEDIRNFSGLELDCTVHSSQVWIPIRRIALQQYLEIDLNIFGFSKK